MRSLLLLVLSSSLVAQAAPEAAPSTEDVTWSGHVAKIVYNSCSSCHQPGEAAPFDLLSYDDCHKRARMIARVTKSRYMPPWLPVPGHGEFEDSRRLSDKDVAVLTRWAETGAKRGDPTREPEPPKLREGWALGKPDLVVTMDQHFPVPSSGPDIYRNFVIPMDIPEDTWVTAIEIRPSAPSVVHHCLYFTDDTGEARRQAQRSLERTGKPGYRGMGRRSGGLGGWAVGGQAQHLPLGLAYPMPKRSDLVLSMHFHPSGKAEKEKTTIGLHFAKKQPKRTFQTFMIPPLYGITAGLDIPSGDKDFRIKGSFKLPVDADLVTVGGHAHYLCRKMEAEAILPDGKKIALFRINDWDFDWQNRYRYLQPVRLPAGTVIKGWISYDNSEDNPANPQNPPRRVRWGRESTDEMGTISFGCVAANEKDTRLLKSAIRLSMFEGRGTARMGRFAGRMIQRVKDMDRDGDGALEKDEVPAQARQLMEWFDLNGDGMIDREEFEALEERFGGGDDSDRPQRRRRRGGGDDER